MSANIFYKPVNPAEGAQLSVDAPSYFIESMRRCFGQPPWKLSDAHLLQLLGMSAVYRAGHGNPYDEMSDAIDECGEIEVWAEN